MPRAVLNTNVLISGLCYGGPPGLVLDAAQAGRVDLVTSPVLIAEFERVMRLKFPGREAETLETLAELAAFWEVVTPGIRLALVRRDPADDRVLECALAARADFIVTGDKHLLALGRFRGVRILAPSVFLAQLES